MQDQNFNQSIQHFCGGSQATGLFMEANYHGGIYTKPLNTQKDPNLLYGTSLENIMFAKNYNQSSKVAGMSEDDVHHQYVDFIVRTALFHREIDNPTTLGSGLNTIREILKEGVDKLLEAKLSTLNLEGTLDGLLNSRGWIRTTKRERIAQAVEAQPVSLAELEINQNSSFYNYINAVLLLLLLGISPIVPLPTENLPQNADQLSKQKTVIPEMYDGDIDYPQTPLDLDRHQFKTQLKYILGNCSKKNGRVRSGALGNLCVSSFLQNNTTVATKLDEILTRNGNPNKKNEILEKINDKLLRFMIEYAMEMYKILGGLGKIYDTYHRGDPASKLTYLKQLVKTINSRQDMAQSLKSAILDKTYEVIRPELNSSLVDNYTNVDANDHAKKMFENVFLNWTNLDSSAREFYRTHLHLFRLVGNVRGDQMENSNGWEDIGDRVGNEAFLKTLDKNKVRINLMKVREGAVDVLFGKTLPFLPMNINKVWYTNASSGAPTSLDVHDLEETFFQQLYSCVYNNTECNFNGQRLNLPRTFREVESKNKDFDINDILVVKNFVSARKQVGLNNPSQSHHSFDELFVEDMVTRVVYKRSVDGELVHIGESGELKPYTIDEISVDNCLGTRLKGDRMQCSRLVRECLLSGNKDQLNECIGQMRMANMFEVAQSEISKSDPNVAVQILRTFGVGRVVKKDPILGEIWIPQTFDHWKETTLNELRPALREAILTDTKLCDYLKGVIAFITMNPAILNKGVKQENKVSLADQQLNDPYLNALGKNLFINPTPASQEAKLFSSKMLIKSIQYPQLATSSNAHITNPFNNVTNVNGVVALPAINTLRGGASSYENSVMRKIKKNGSTSQLIKTIMENLFEEMKQGGIPLNSADVARINDGINKLAHGEEKLGKYYGMLRALTDLALFFKASGCSVQQNVELKELSLDDIKSRSQTLEYLYQNIGTIQNCIGEGIDKQNAKCKELINYYEILVNNVAGSDKVVSL